MTDWQNLSDAILHHAEDRPHMPAIIDGKERLSYAQFAALIRRAITYLREIGIEEGERIGIALPSSADHLILLIALIRMGAVVTELPLAVPLERRAHIVRKLGLRKLALENAATAPPGIAAIEITAQWRSEIEQKAGDGGDAAEPDLVVMTSGSTGLPKALVLTERRFVRRFDLHPEMLYDGEPPSPNRPSALLLHGDTLAYVGFFCWTMGHLYRGGPVVLLPRIASDELISSIASWEDAIFLATPNLCRLFLRRAPQRGLLFPRLRLLLSAGQPLFAEEKRRIIAAVTPTLRENYGCAGGGTISFLRADEMLRKAGSVGRPAPDVDAEIVDLNDLPVPTGRTGRLRVRAPGMAVGYHNERGEMVGPEGFHDGWFYPGEVASFDEDGYLYIRGRAADLIRRNGTAVFPTEIEEVLLSHPAVWEAAVFGMPEGAESQQVVAVVVLRQPVPHGELMRHCMERLPSVKRPDRICRATTLPKLTSGKLAIARLRTLVAAAGAAHPLRTAPTTRASR